MPNFIANSVFEVEGREYQPGETVPRSLPEWEKLLEKGYIVWEGGARAAREAAEKEAAEQAAREAAEKEAAEQAAKEAAEKEAAEQAAKEAAEPNEKPVKGRKAKAET